MWRRPDLWLNCCKGKKLFSYSAFSQGELHVLQHFSTLTLAYYCDAHRNLSFHYTSSRSCPGPTYFNCAYKQSTMAVHDDVIVKPSFQSEYSYPTARFIRIKRQYAEKKMEFFLDFVLFYGKNVYICKRETRESALQYRKIGETAFKSSFHTTRSTISPWRRDRTQIQHKKRLRV